MTDEIFSGDHFDSYLDSLINLSFEEDIREGDHTSLATIPENSPGQARLLVKESGVLAGMQVVERVFNKIDPKLILNTFIKDGEQISTGDIVFEVSGSVRSILTAERLALNFLQHLSGVATKTATLVELVKGFNVRLLDTRKTTPGLRLLEKYAVRAGGGANHRIGLFDMILIKDNHVDHAGSISKALSRVRDYLDSRGLNLPIELEVRTLREVGEVLDIGGVDRILLDNFSPLSLKEAVAMIGNKFQTEASGGINRENLKEFAATGVNFISTSELTRNFKPLDMSLKLSD